MNKDRLRIHLKTWTIRSFLTRILVFSILWWILSEGTFREWPLIVLAVLAASVASLALVPAGLWKCRPMGLLRFLAYFLKEAVLGGFDVARRALSPSMPLKPGFVEYQHSLAETPSVLFAWSISLLPGTSSVQLRKNSVTVHVLDQENPVAEKLQTLEKRVTAVFESSLPKRNRDE